jgi:C4-dicarboxylate-specific signal transduction histidine kinase
MKLFSKVGEDRYQTVAGLERDLQHWLTEWAAQRRIEEDFPLGENDTSGRLLIPKRVKEAIRQLETELAHMNRVSMVGELAASLFHEITQPIASARNNARAALNFLNEQPPDLGEVREALGCVVSDADRAGDIVDRIRAHIKKAPPRKERFDLNATINEVIGLAQSAIIRNSVSVACRRIIFRSGRSRSIATSGPELDPERG